MLISDIARALLSDRWALATHARERAGRRRIRSEELVQMLADGEVLEDYPLDPRGPSAVVLGRTGNGRALRVACVLDPREAIK